MAVLAVLRRFVEDEDAPTAVEYAVMLSVLVAGIIVAVVFLRNKLRDSFQGTADHFPT